MGYLQWREKRKKMTLELKKMGYLDTFLIRKKRAELLLELGKLQMQRDDIYKHQPLSKLNRKTPLWEIEGDIKLLKSVLSSSPEEKRAAKNFADQILFSPEVVDAFNNFGKRKKTK